MLELEVRPAGAEGRCAYCLEDLTAAAVACPACRVRVHRECAEELTRCTTIGCRGRPREFAAPAGGPAARPCPWCSKAPPATPVERVRCPGCGEWHNPGCWASVGRCAACGDPGGPRPGASPPDRAWRWLSGMGCCLLLAAALFALWIGFLATAEAPDPIARTSQKPVEARRLVTIQRVDLPPGGSERVHVPTTEAVGLLITAVGDELELDLLVPGEEEAPPSRSAAGAGRVALWVEGFWLWMHPERWLRVRNPSPTAPVQAQVCVQSGSWATVLARLEQSQERDHLEAARLLVPVRTLTLPAGRINFETFTLDVPEGCPALVVTTVGAAPEVDLFLRHGQPMADWDDDPDLKVDLLHADEVVYLHAGSTPPLRPGRWHVDVKRVGSAAIGPFELLARAGPVEELVADLEAALGRDLDHHALRMHLALIDLARGHPDARRRLEAAAAALPERAEPRLRLAELLAAAGDPAAEAQYLEAARLDARYAFPRGTLRASAWLPLELPAGTSTRVLRLEVPAGCTALDLRLEGAPIDLDLVLRRSLPALTWPRDADHAGRTTEPDEALRVTPASDPPLVPGAPYYLTVIGTAEGVAGFRLRVTFEGTPAPAPPDLAALLARPWPIEPAALARLDAVPALAGRALVPLAHLEGPAGAALVVWPGWDAAGGRAEEKVLAVSLGPDGAPGEAWTPTREETRRRLGSGFRARPRAAGVASHQLGPLLEALSRDVLAALEGGPAPDLPRLQALGAALALLFDLDAAVHDGFPGGWLGTLHEVSTYGAAGWLDLDPGQGQVLVAVGEGAARGPRGLLTRRLDAEEGGEERWVVD